MFFQFIKKSSNAKTGAIPVTNSSRDTCPPACPLRGDAGCYDEALFWTRLNWDKVDSGERGGSWSDLCDHIRALPDGQLWRHNVAGDLPPSGKNQIHISKLLQLIEANSGRKGFTYTHYPMTFINEGLVNMANRRGFTINASADTEKKAVNLYRRELPTVALVAANKRGADWRKFKRDGVQFVRCPAEYLETDCAACQLCQRSDRRCIVGFTPHGSNKNSAEIIASN